MTLPQSSGEQPGKSETVTSKTGASAFAAALAAEIGDEDQDKPGETGDDESNDEGKPAGESRKKAKPASLEAVAEALGLEVSDLYAVSVPASGGREAMTIGQIKDRFAEWDTLEAERLAFSESRVEQEGTLARAKQELQELFSLIPKDKLQNVDVLRQVAARVAARNQAQEAEVLAAFPEWKDPATKSAQRAELAKMLEGYGYAAAEFAAIRDPRLLKFIRDSYRREQQVKAALAKVRPLQKRPAGSSSPGGSAAPAREERATPSPLKPTTGRGRFLTELHKP